ncbi:MAG: 50S ribosomal protein L32e [Candidatus Woesearchaeota archaeon]
MRDLLAVRNSLKKKKPTFSRQDSHKIKRLKKSWRRPKGWHSKMRMKIKGYRRSVEPGWGSPRAVKGLHSSGLAVVRVNRVEDVEQITKKQCIEIGKGVGIKKKMAIVELALKKNIMIVNVKDPKGYIAKVEESIKKRKEKTTKVKKVEAPKKSIEEAVEGEEDKKKREKKEFDKLLTKEQK